VRQLHTWDRKYALVSELYGQLASHQKQPGQAS
jgi:hypothetical protein